MNRRAFSAYALAALVVALLVPSNSQAQLSPRFITGDWSVQSAGVEFHKGIMHLTQQGYTVVGHLKGPRGTISLNGKLNNNVLSATWHGPTGETGWLTFNFAPSFLSFNGDYGYAGRKPTGQVIGKLVKSTAM
ncbi:MAG: hypothetical protein ACXVAW_19060 [Vulcanimicrobiaceae bacterium]